MINVLFYSIAGKPTHEQINDVLVNLQSLDCTPAQEKKVIAHVLEVAEHGNYPSAEYFQTFYSVAPFTYKTLAEIKEYATKVEDFFTTQSISSKVIKTINESNNSTELRNTLAQLLEDAPQSAELSLDAFKPILYSESNRPETRGIETCIKEIDEATNGFQQGTIAVICAFTGEGKSTCANSIIFHSVTQGKKCCIVSLELAPELMWCMFQARWLYQTKGVQVTAQDLQQRKLTKEQAENIKQYDDEFREWAKNLLIVDESLLNLQRVTDPHQMTSLYRLFDEKLGGLDCILFDHVGQFELLYPEHGNQILKCIQSVTKTYESTNGVRPCTLWCVQANREGNKRAQSRQGVYDLQAIADLNETERSASYVVFLYTDDNMKMVQETKVTLAKNRLGRVVSEPVIAPFLPAVITVGDAKATASASKDVFSSEAFTSGSFDEIASGGDMPQWMSTDFSIGDEDF